VLALIIFGGATIYFVGEIIICQILMLRFHIVAERKRKKRKSYTDLFSFTFFSEQEVS
jgi:hypothetical protein